MESFAEYILKEESLVEKIEIVYYLAKKARIFFDKSVLFKTEITRMFIDYMKLDVDRNLVLTASLLCNCKKVDDAQKLGKLHTYALDGALYLKTLGFDNHFCKICEEINRYSESTPRERESDILELVDNFGGMLLDRPERIGLDTEEALVLLEHRNLKDKYNRFLNIFHEFVNEMDEIQIKDVVNTTPFKKLVKIHNESEDIKEFVKILANEYVPQINELVVNRNNELSRRMFGEKDNPNRPLFSESTTLKVMGYLKNNQESQKNED